MHAAQVTSWSNPPTYTSVPEPPEPSDSQMKLRVLATAIHQLVRSRATGKHYTSKSLPHLPGVDGVGEDVATGKKYYFFAMATGTFADFVTVPKQAAWELPSGGDPVTVAALLNPTMSSWMAIQTRTVGLTPGFSVAILGVTSASGRLAIDVARAKGASRIVGIARNAAAMEKLKLDEIIVLSPETDWSKLGEIDVVLDYINGKVALELLQALPPSPKEVQYVGIGAVSGEMETPIPAALLRSKRLTLRGAGPGAWSMQEFSDEAPGMLKLVSGVERGSDIAVKKLEEVEAAWVDKNLASKRVVFVPE